MRSNTQRLRTLTLVWALLFALAFVRMASLQVFGASGSQGNRQLIRETRIAAERGDIVDRSGIPLAISIREWRLVANPREIQKGKLVESHAEAIAQRLGVDAAVIKQRLMVDRSYAIVARGLSEPLANVFRTSSARLDFIAVEEEPRRMYPAGDLARGVLGSVRRIDQVGQSGFELKFEQSLQGVAGEMKVERDRKGGQIPANRGINQPPKRGTSFQTTIDRSLQYQVEGYLAKAIALTGSENGVVIVSEVGTGEILAVANMTVDADRNVVNTGRNSAFVSAYELGSVNKAVTIAAALEEGVVSPTTRTAVPDRLTVWDKTFKDDVTHPTMAWTPGEILTASSNIGTIKIAKQLGKRRLNSYLRKFGMGEQTAVAFPGESAGILPKPSKWSGTSIGTISIGQGIAMTAAQMIDVYNTIANGGERRPLRLVRATIEADGKTTPVSAEPAVRVVSQKTASELTTMLIDVVENGTGTAAAIPGYTVAGKTGTAQKPEKSGYSKTRYVASFAGFFPAEKPVLSAIVVLDEPKTSIYGGHIAAPLFSEVGRAAASTYRVPPSPGRQLVVNRNVSPAEGSLAWHRALLRKGALSLAPVTPAELGQQRVGTVTRSDLPAGTLATIETSTTLAPEPVSSEQVAGTGELASAGGNGGIVYFDSQENAAADAGGVPATLPPTPAAASASDPETNSGLAPESPALVSAAVGVPVRNGIPDLSPQSAYPLIRPRALATPMTLRAGATEHNGHAKQATDTTDAKVGAEKDGAAKVGGTDHAGAGATTSADAKNQKNTADKSKADKNKKRGSASGNNADTNKAGKEGKEGKAGKAGKVGKSNTSGTSGASGKSGGKSKPAAETATS